MLRKVGSYASALLIISVVSIKNGQGAICYKCDAHNPNCADPVVLDAPGVETCIAPYCIKSVINHEGISVGLRMCATSPTMEDGCIQQIVGGMPAVACICTEDFCNGSH